MPIGYNEHTHHVNAIANTLQISTMFTQTTPLTPLDTTVNTPPPPRLLPPVKHFYPKHPTNGQSRIPLKYSQQFCYYIDGSFKPLKGVTRVH